MRNKPLALLGALPTTAPGSNNGVLVARDTEAKAFVLRGQVLDIDVPVAAKFLHFRAPVSLASRVRPPSRKVSR